MNKTNTQTNTWIIQQLCVGVIVYKKIPLKCTEAKQHKSRAHISINSITQHSIPKYIKPQSSLPKSINSLVFQPIRFSQSFLTKYCIQHIAATLQEQHKSIKLQHLVSPELTFYGGYSHRFISQRAY